MATFDFFYTLAKELAVNKPIVIEVPKIEVTSLEQLARLAGFASGNGLALAEAFDKEKRFTEWSDGQAVCIMSFGEHQFDCVHSQYGAALNMRGPITELLQVTGLYMLAAHLRQHPAEILRGFEGYICAFGEPEFRKHRHLDTGNHIAFEVWDMFTSGLYLRDGHPMAIYQQEHTSEASQENFAASFGPAYLYEERPEDPKEEEEN